VWRGRHRKHSLVYCCVLDRVYRAVAWQRVDQIRYNILLKYMNDQIKWDEMGRTCNTDGEKMTACSVLVGKPEGKRPLGRTRRRWD
jgi:hypothetical protein